MSCLPNNKCFVIMPLGEKQLPDGTKVDFESVYQNLFLPALSEAGLTPILAGDTYNGGTIHKHMLDKLLLCEFVLADMTLDLPHVFWGLGVRHGFHPGRTLVVRGRAAHQEAKSFDIGFMPHMSYSLSRDGDILDLAVQRCHLLTRLREAQKTPHSDSTLYSLIQGARPSEIDRRKTDVLLRHFEEASEGLQGELAKVMRQKDKDAVRAGFQALMRQYAPVAALDAFSQTALFLAHREAGLWQDMVDLYSLLDVSMQQSLLIREQYALALNRCGTPDSPQSRKAETLLLDCVREHGPSSETHGLLGRIYKDRYAFYQAQGMKAAAREALEQAIAAYTEGFRADSRDAYPGINAATLRELTGESVRPEHRDMLAAVKWAARQRITTPTADYWDYATLVEAAALDRDWQTAESFLERALVRGHVMPWMRETTANNLRLLSKTRSARGENCGPLDILVAKLEKDLPA